MARLWVRNLIVSCALLGAIACGNKSSNNENGTDNSNNTATNGTANANAGTNNANAGTNNANAGTNNNTNAGTNNNTNAGTNNNTNAGTNNNTNGTNNNTPVTVQVVMPKDDNLQFMNFWVAQGAGYLEDEGVEVEIVTPPMPGAAGMFFMMNQMAGVALLPPPMYLGLIATEEPIVLFANLQSGEPVNVLMRDTTQQATGVALTDPVADRVQALEGMEIGGAPGVPTRLRIMLEEHGLDFDQDITFVEIKGPMQDMAFANGDIDVLFTHTPHLEEAILNQGGVLFVDLSGGEIAALAGGDGVHQSHSLVTKQSYASENPDALQAMTNAMLRAQNLIHSDQDAAVTALQAVFPDLDAEFLSLTVEIYEQTMPETPVNSEAGIMRALELYPAHRTPPDLSGVTLSDFFTNEYVDQAVAGQ